MNNKAKPVFKYIGGKSWLKKALRLKTATLLSKKNSIQSYTEPFCGSLGAFFAIYDILLQHQIRNIQLNDINQKIITFYTTVKDNPYQLLNSYKTIEEKFTQTIPEKTIKLHKIKDKTQIKILLQDANYFFKEIKIKFNNNDLSVLEQSAILLFLQNHCFNGIYRENLKGEYNTPFNWDGKIINMNFVKNKIIHAQEVFNYFRNFELTSKNFSKLSYDKKILYYLDPPYINDSLNVNKYNKTEFGLNQQMELLEQINGNTFIYSNHANNKLIEKINTLDNVVDIEFINRKNIISASKESRKNDKKEILVMGY